MALSKGQRTVLAESFAHLIGGVDSEGREHRLARTEAQAQIKRKQHLFAVLETEKENMMWEFVNGQNLLEFIRTGRYKIEYLGLNRDHLANKKVRQKMLEQVKQQVEGIKAKHERQGRFESDEFYQKLLDEKTAPVKAKFEEYDKSKETA
jgi:hypothetical protein